MAGQGWASWRPQAALKMPLTLCICPHPRRLMGLGAGHLVPDSALISSWQKLHLYLRAFSDHWSTMTVAAGGARRRNPLRAALNQLWELRITGVDAQTPQHHLLQVW